MGSNLLASSMSSPPSGGEGCCGDVGGRGYDDDDVDDGRESDLDDCDLGRYDNEAT
jgi:hypothetical protein